MPDCVSVTHEFDAIVDFHIAINHGCLRIVIINDRCDANFPDICSHEIWRCRLVPVRAALVSDNIKYLAHLGAVLFSYAHDKRFVLDIEYLATHHVLVGKFRSVGGRCECKR